VFYSEANQTIYRELIEHHEATKKPIDELKARYENIVIVARRPLTGSEGLGIEAPDKMALRLVQWGGTNEDYEVQLGLLKVAESALISEIDALFFDDLEEGVV